MLLPRSVYITRYRNECLLVLSHINFLSFHTRPRYFQFTPTFATSPPRNDHPAATTIMTLTRFLVISDTHDTWPYTSSSPPPATDVLLHCGDLTQLGGLSSFERAMEHIKSVPCELKLVIAGNHDLQLDPIWIRKNAAEESLDIIEELEWGRKCYEHMKSLEPHGIYYLSEGVHEFTLKSGARFKVYASPYTPEFKGHAFAYGNEEDRFNLGRSPIPAGVDIVMTHGPPLLQHMQCDLDCDIHDRRLGCEKLMEAIQRTKPRLHCFGHVHEGRGSARLTWEEKAGGGMKSFEPLGRNIVIKVRDERATVL
jgi:predicted phosphohydrolase